MRRSRIFYPRFFLLGMVIASVTLIITGLAGYKLEQLRLATGFVPTPQSSQGPSGFSKASFTVPILLYHYVEYNQDAKDTIRTSLAVTPHWFEKQLQYLKEQNYKIISLTDLFLAIRGKKTIPQKAVVLTFDDGYRDFYTDAWPILKKYQAKATLFIVPNFLDRHNYLYTWQLKEIATDSSKLVTIGAHTLNHVNLVQVTPDLAFTEINGSKEYLEKHLKIPIVAFAYPYGAYNELVSNYIQKAGFQTAVSTKLGNAASAQNQYYLPRIRIGNYAGAAFEGRLNGK